MEAKQKDSYNKKEPMFMSDDQRGESDPKEERPNPAAAFAADFARHWQKKGGKPPIVLGVSLEVVPVPNQTQGALATFTLVQHALASAKASQSLAKMKRWNMREVYALYLPMVRVLEALPQGDTQYVPLEDSPEVMEMRKAIQQVVDISSLDGGQMLRLFLNLLGAYNDDPRRVNLL